MDNKDLHMEIILLGYPCKFPYNRKNRRIYSLNRVIPNDDLYKVRYEFSSYLTNYKKEIIKPYTKIYTVHFFEELLEELRNTITHPTIINEYITYRLTKLI